MYCDHCGRLIPHCRPDQSFCNRQCRNRFYYLFHRKAPKEYKKTCKVCSKEFISNTDNRVYCNDLCRHEANLSNSKSRRTKKTINVERFSKLTVLFGKLQILMETTQVPESVKALIKEAQ